MSNTYKHAKHNMLLDNDDIVLVIFETFVGVDIVMILSKHDITEHSKKRNVIWDNLSIYINQTKNIE
jgi:hypothetical protein